MWLVCTRFLKTRIILSLFLDIILKKNLIFKDLFINESLRKSYCINFILNFSTSFSTYNVDYMQLPQWNKFKDNKVHVQVLINNKNMAHSYIKIHVFIYFSLVLPWQLVFRLFANFSNQLFNSFKREIFIYYFLMWFNV